MTTLSQTQFCDPCDYRARTTSPWPNGDQADRSSSSVPFATPSLTRLLIFEGLLIRPGESFGAKFRDPEKGQGHFRPVWRLTKRAGDFTASP